jgi:hypothetical protein
MYSRRMLSPDAFFSGEQPNEARRGDTDDVRFTNSPGGHLPEMSGDPIRRRCPTART